MIYTGIGSRQTPNEHLIYMQHLAYELALQGFVLRSGHAEGADTAFENGCDYGKGRKQIFIPWEGFNGARTDSFQSPYKIPIYMDRCMEIAAQFHPAWDKCTEGGKKLHARNVCQIGGPFLDKPSNFVVCWTERGIATGGTAMAIKIAEYENIPVFNVAKEKDIEALNEFLNTWSIKYGLNW